MIRFEKWPVQSPVIIELLCDDGGVKKIFFGSRLKGCETSFFGLYPKMALSSVFVISFPVLLESFF